MEMLQAQMEKMSQEFMEQCRINNAALASQLATGTQTILQNVEAIVDRKLQPMQASVDHVLGEHTQVLEIWLHFLLQISSVAFQFRLHTF